MSHPRRPPKPSTYPDRVGDYRLNRTRLLSKVIEDPATGCWNYYGPRHVQGYGFTGAYRISDNTKIQMTAHRASYMLHHGPLTARNVIHTCSNMACINPAHLIAGDQQKTMEVMIAAGRQNRTRRPYGPRAPDWTNPREGCKMARRPSWAYKWTDEEIRFLRVASLDDIQARFNYNRPQASAARHKCRRGYKWLP